MVACIITPFTLGFELLLLYRDYRNGREDATRWGILVSWDRSMPAPKRTVFNRQFWLSLVAVLVGNAIYYGLYRFLPPRAQHQPYHIDWGLAVDFWICVICYFLVRMIR